MPACIQSGLPGLSYNQLYHNTVFSSIGNAIAYGNKIVYNNKVRKGDSHEHIRSRKSGLQGAGRVPFRIEKANLAGATESL